MTRVGAAASGVMRVGVALVAMLVLFATIVTVPMVVVVAVLMVVGVWALRSEDSGR